MSFPVQGERKLTFKPCTRTLRVGLFPCRCVALIVFCLIDRSFPNPLTIVLKSDRIRRERADMPRPLAESVEAPADYYSRSRKRPHENDGEEFMPISKKLNNLHIDVRAMVGDSSVNGGRSDANDHHLLGVHDDAMHHESHEHLATNHDRSHNHASSHDLTTHNPYLPSLSSTENPLYYEANRVLYEAHLARQERSSRRRDNV